MYSITLQTNDTVVSSGDILGRLQFAASAEADGGASQLIGAGIYGMGEGSFGSSSNPASLVFITSADDSNAAVPRIKISEDGDIIPIQGSHNIGEPGNSFNTIYATGLDTRYIALASNVPADTTNKLYNDNGTLKFNGSSIGGAGGGGLNDLIDDTSPQLGANLDINTYSVTGVGNINIDGDITAENFYGDLDGPIVVECKNQTGSDIAAGTPVYVSGYYGTNGKASVAPADAADPSKMPAIGIIETALTSDSEGHVHCFGLSKGFDTSSFTVGQTVYVASGGGLTNSRPSGATDLVQNIGRVLRSDSSQGRILVLGPGRTNDTPNSLDITGTITAPNIGTGEDDSVVVLDSGGKLRTDEIDSRVWGTSLLANVVEDTSPQLGGNLDLDTYSVTGVGGININNDIVASGELKIGGYQPSDLENPGYLSVGEVRIQQGAPPTYVSSYKLYDIVTDSTNHRVGINMHDGSVYSELAPENTLDVNGTFSCPTIVAQENGGWQTLDGGYWYSSVKDLSVQLDPSVTNQQAGSPGLLIGEGAKNYAPNSMVFATNYFTNKGDAQRVFHVIQGQSTDASDRYLSTDKSGSNYSSAFYVGLGTVLTFTLHIAANNDTDDTAAGWIIRGCIKNSTGTPQVVGSLITENFADASMSSASVSVVPNGTFDRMNIKINGISGKTIRWVCSLDGVVSCF